MYANDVKIYIPVCDNKTQALRQVDLIRISILTATLQQILNAKTCVSFRLRPQFALLT